MKFEIKNLNYLSLLKNYYQELRKVADIILKS